MARGASLRHDRPHGAGRPTRANALYWLEELRIAIEDWISPRFSGYFFKNGVGRARLPALEEYKLKKITFRNLDSWLTSTTNWRYTLGLDIESNCFAGPQALYLPAQSVDASTPDRMIWLDIEGKPSDFPNDVWCSRSRVFCFLALRRYFESVTADLDRITPTLYSGMTTDRGLPRYLLLYSQLTETGNVLERVARDIESDPLGMRNVMQGLKAVKRRSQLPAGHGPRRAVESVPATGTSKRTGPSVVM